MIAGIPIATILTFMAIGIKVFGMDWILKIFAVLLVLFVAKFVGWINPGNLASDKKKTENSPLKGKHILFLGSSVTKGFASYGKSFVDMIAARTGAVVTKEAVSGTTLVDKKGFTGESYITRMKKLDTTVPYDLFVCQLSTNDSTMNLPLGTVDESKDIDSFDTQTVCGAIEYIIAYVKQTWNCPVAFYTNPQYNAPAYLAMVEALESIASKWEISVIDLWHDAEVNSKKNRKVFRMNDQIHPTRKGYVLWTPIVEDALVAMLEGKALPQRAKVVSPTKQTLTRKAKGASIKGWIVRIIVILLALAIALLCAGFQTINGTAGLIKDGNDEKYDLETVTPLENSPLKDKNVLFLGSSVAQGLASRRTSYCEYLARLDGLVSIKEAVGATTVANTGDTSYNPRLRQYDASTPVDAIVIQLSSNDSTLGSSLGELSESLDPADIDDTTFVGGMEALVAYSRATWGEDVPIVIYSNPKFRGKTFYNTEAYDAMVQKTKAVCEKWDVTFLNMWEDEEMNSIPMSDYELYMSDPVHPTKAGYLLWWTPKFQEVLYEIFQ